MRGAHALLHRLAHLSSLLLQHVALQTDGEPWSRLAGVLASVEEGEEEGEEGEGMTVDGLRAAHAAYIAEVAARCFVPSSPTPSSSSSDVPTPTSGSGGSDGGDGESDGGIRRAHAEMEGLVAFVAAACQALEDAVLVALLPHGSAHANASNASSNNAATPAAVVRALALRVSQVRARLRVRVARLAEEVCALRLKARVWGAGGGVGGFGGRGSAYAESLVRGLEDVLEAGRC